MSKINFGDLAYVLEDEQFNSQPQRLDEANQNLGSILTKAEKAIEKAKMDREKAVKVFAKDVEAKLRKIVDDPNASGWKLDYIETPSRTWEISWSNTKNGENVYIEFDPEDVLYGDGLFVIYNDTEIDVDATSNAIVQVVASEFGGPGR